MDMALFAMGEGDNRVAEDEVKLYLMARPADTNARLLLANLTNQQGRIDDAREILETLRLEDEKTPVFWVRWRVFTSKQATRKALSSSLMKSSRCKATHRPRTSFPSWWRLLSCTKSRHSLSARI
jgi:thioredoxin-like negative regulator of GroEL